ncbi:RluA family pseudouridine synthase [Candidatus Saccharibacteria bacterium]|nr:RluA family pseudouridine synthase [Candidatus Saccharibacteria bacterium]
MKFSKKDVVKILWEFDRLDGAEVVDDALITIISVKNPDPKNTLLSFAFNGVNYFALFDEVDDDLEKVKANVKRVAPNAEVEVLRSPKMEEFGAKWKGKEMYLVVQLNQKRRLDVWLSEKYPDVNRSTWGKYVKEGRVKVGGVIETKSSRMVEEKDGIEVDLPEDLEFKDELRVIYEDDDVVVIDKPAGVLTHSKGNLNDEFTVANFFERRAVDLEESNRVGVVHRLDRETSGVMIGAKTEAARLKLQKQFSDRKVRKVYYAVVDGRPKTDKALISLPIARNMKRPTTFVVSPNGRPAETVYEVVKSGDEFSLVRLEPKTGRTHQIRIHMKYVGCPIVGDRIYGEEGDGRMYLHAAELEVTLPNGERKVFKSEVPSEFMAKAE